MLIGRRGRVSVVGVELIVGAVGGVAAVDADAVGRIRHVHRRTLEQQPWLCCTAALKEIKVLVGKWNQTATPAGGEPWPGEAKTTFEWLEGGPGDSPRMP